MQSLTEPLLCTGGRDAPCDRRGRLWLNRSKRCRDLRLVAVLIHHREGIFTFRRHDRHRNEGIIPIEAL